MTIQVDPNGPQRENKQIQQINELNPSARLYTLCEVKNIGRIVTITNGGCVAVILSLSPYDSWVFRAGVSLARQTNRGLPFDYNADKDAGIRRGKTNYGPVLPTTYPRPPSTTTTVVCQFVFVCMDYIVIPFCFSISRYIKFLIWPCLKYY